MAGTAQVETNPDLDPSDPEGDFINAVAEKWEKKDQEREARGERREADTNDDYEIAPNPEDREGDEDEESDASTDDSGSETDTDDDEDTDSDTSADDRDGGTDDSEEDSSEDDADEHTADDESEDSDDDATDGDDDSDEAEEDDESAESEDDDDDTAISEDFREVAERSDIPTTLDDVKDPAGRRLVAQKLRAMDAGYTQMAQKLTAFRKDEARLRAEEKFRTENPDLVIVEMLKKGGEELLKKVNARQERLVDPDAEEVFDSLVEGRRAKATREVEATLSASDRLAERVGHVENLTWRLAAKANLPREYAERAIENAILRLPKGSRDLTDSQIAEIVQNEARVYTRHARAGQRERSREVVRERTANRKSASRPGSKTPASAASPKPGVRKEPKIDYNDEDSRQNAMMRTARRLFKGAKDS